MTDPRPKKGEKTPDLPIQRFHAASSPFTVERDLKVELSWKRAGKGEGPVRPGEEIEVTIKTTDPQGKPVAAELSLGMVEKSLLDRFASSLAPIQAFFRGNPREPAVRTTSSITFAYKPTTRPINTRLLAESDRLAVEREEAASRSELAGARADELRRAAPGTPGYALAPEAAPAPTSAPALAPPRPSAVRQIPAGDMVLGIPVQGPYGAELRSRCKPAAAAGALERQAGGAGADFDQSGLAYFGQAAGYGFRRNGLPAWRANWLRARLGARSTPIATDTRPLMPTT